MNDEVRKIAYEFYLRNRRGITEQIATSDQGVKPSKKRERQPELWDADNWRWFYEH